MLAIEADWERLPRGSPEERACFAALGIRFGATWLTQAEDTFVNRVRDKVHLSAYRLAEWFAWNWWRLRWEPFSKAPGWGFAHEMSAAGGGYVWPSITVISDGERVAFAAKPTERRTTEPLRYIADLVAIVPATIFEGAIDNFVEQVLAQLRAESVDTTNLDLVWDDVKSERLDEFESKRRRFEALLGLGPDEADEATIERALCDADSLGAPAISELLAEHSLRVADSRLQILRTIASRQGFDASLKDAVSLRDEADLPRIGEVAAWRRGAAAAVALRQQEDLGAAPISNTRLADLAGVPVAALSHSMEAQKISFALFENNVGRVVLRSKWEAGRRFDLARIIGDRVATHDGSSKLFPATRTYTYRQKVQRAFAAEFLSPFHVVDDMLADDRSDERIEEVAEHFNVSERTVETLLVNHGRIGREGFVQGVYEPFAT